MKAFDGVDNLSKRSAMRRAAKILIFAVSLTCLTACAGPLSTKHSFDAVATHVTEEQLTDCVERLKTYKHKGIFETLRYELTGPLRPSPGLVCLATVERQLGHKMAIYAAPVKQISVGREDQPSGIGTEFLMCKFSIVDKKVKLTRWRVGRMKVHGMTARVCGVRTRQPFQLFQ